MAIKKQAKHEDVVEELSKVTELTAKKIEPAVEESIKVIKTVSCKTFLNIRKEADINSEKVGSFNNGEKVEVGNFKNGFYETEKGWIMAKFLK